MMQEGNSVNTLDKSSTAQSLQILEDGPGRNKKTKLLDFFKRNALTLGTVIGVVLGVIVGFILRSTKKDWSSRECMYIGFLGELFLRMLKCLILPLIMSSLVSAISGLDLSLSRRIAIRTISFYMVTTVIAVIEGIILVNTIQPGSNHSGSKSSSTPVMTRNVTTADTLLDLVRNMFPPNIIQAAMETAQTSLTVNKSEKDIYKWEIGDEVFVSGSNIIGVVVFSAVFGIAVAILGEESKPVMDFFKSLVKITMKLTHWCIMLSPAAVFFLVTARIVKMGDMATVIAQLGLYFMTVLLGLGIHGFIVLPTIYFLLTKKSPVRYLFNLKPAIVTAFGTASSAATLPLTIECLEDISGIDPRITRFALPIGATINLDGTALYEAVAAIFIAQVHNVPMTLGKIIAVSITATAASMGAAGIPQAGLVTMVMVLDTVGLPASEIGLIYAVDWLLDRFRTTINVMGDAFGAGIVFHRSQKDLPML